MPLKIKLLGTAYPYRGGLASFNERLIEEFINEQEDASIETFKLQYPNFLFPGKTQYSSSPKPSNIPIDVTVNSVNPFNWIKIGRKIKKEEPDILIIKFWLPFMAPCFGTIARIAKKNKKTRVISILDNVVPHEKRPGDKLLAKYFVNSVDAFVGMSKSVLEDLNQFDSSKPREYNPHPLFDNFGEKVPREEALKHLQLPQGDKYILFFGFIRDYKGLDLLIDAFSDCRFRDQGIKLIIAGEYYNNEEQYTEQIKKLNLQGDIILKNEFIPNEDVRYYFGAADIVAQPYKNATQSGVTQIGYHFEKPMLVTNVGGLAELVPHNKIGYVVNPDPKSIADSLLNFFDSDNSSNFIENILEEKKKFSWDKMTQTIKKLYHAVQK